MYREEIQNYYSDKGIQKQILEFAEGRELVPILASGGFGSRPNAVFYEGDIEALVKQGAISLHGSIERWSNPLALRKESKKSELDSLRTGWDLIIDIDCDRGLDYSKKAAIIILNELENMGISDYSVKFSGNRGFHIGVAFESFPAEIMGVGEIKNQFPHVPKIIIQYLTDYTREAMKKSFGENPDDVLKLDAAVAASRHLIRLPYCIHRKTMLVSVPIAKDQIRDFDPKEAEPSKVSAGLPFLSRSPKTGEATKLLSDAVGWYHREKQYEKETITAAFKVPESAVKPEFFPPCIKNILRGLEDGKKRSVFVLITYLHHIGWKKEDIQSFLLEWNKLNPEPLRENMITAVMENQFSREEIQMAPNCNNMGYYKGYGVCMPDEFCKVINNPVTYTLKRARPGRGKSTKRKARKRDPLPREQDQFEAL